MKLFTISQLEDAPIIDPLVLFHGKVAKAYYTGHFKARTFKEFSGAGSLLAEGYTLTSLSTGNSMRHRETCPWQEKLFIKLSESVIKELQRVYDHETTRGQLEYLQFGSYSKAEGRTTVPLKIVVRGSNTLSHWTNDFYLGHVMVSQIQELINSVK